MNEKIKTFNFFCYSRNTKPVLGFKSKNEGTFWQRQGQGGRQAGSKEGKKERRKERREKAVMSR